MIDSYAQQYILKEEFEPRIKIMRENLKKIQEQKNLTSYLGKKVKKTYIELNKVKPKELPLIRVGFYKGKYVSIDNRRLWCYKRQGLKKLLQFFYSFFFIVLPFF